MSNAVGSRIVEVVIRSRASQAVKRRASEAFASYSDTRHETSSSGASSGTSSSSEESDFAEENEDEDTRESELDEEPHSRGLRPPGSETPSEKSYRCTYGDCTKSYSKPSRLAEHRRSHTGERPYVCSTCSKSYLRESHLQAHARSHLPASDRPFPCTEAACSKRFWTVQHLNVHVTNVHQGEKPFSCKEDGCNEKFAKHNQLRRHVADVHCPSGTKPYQCVADGCNKSFSTNQRLRKHSKVHEGNRYACGDTSCITTTTSSTASPLYFSTWTVLQAHIRGCHPPTCPHPECEGRVFASQKGLKGHLKVHEDKEIEEELAKVVDEHGRPMKRRRGGEVGRDWACEVGGCVKTFKSKKALTTHNNITHLGRRDHICSHPGCGQTFGYKHLLQRHTAKMHTTGVSSTATETVSTSVDGQSRLDIGWITGTSYTTPSAHNNTRRALIPCPWPDRFGDANLDDKSAAHEGQCAYVFSRAYDLRRHLRADHSLELTKVEVDGWARDWRERHQIPSDDTRT